MRSPHRDAIRTARGLVVKVGTTALTTPSGMFDAGRLAGLAEAVERRMKAGSDVVIVSSGAIAAGIEPLGLSRRPKDLATKQAAASVGQVALVNSWSAAFARYGRTVGQVLLTAHDISMRVQHTNAQRTLDRLRALHAVAIVNENDTVATNEIRFGDNDRLSALVAHLVGADALVLLSDIDGLYDCDPRKTADATFIPEVSGPADLDGVVAGRSSHLGTGGMASKVAAALLAADAGVPVLLAPRPTPRPPRRRHARQGGQPHSRQSGRRRLRPGQQQGGHRAGCSAGRRQDAGRLQRVNRKHEIGDGHRARGHHPRRRASHTQDTVHDRGSGVHPGDWVGYAGDADARDADARDADARDADARYARRGQVRQGRWGRQGRAGRTGNVG